MAAPLTHRIMPSAANVTKTKVNGRTYDPASGAQDVPEFDAIALQAAGWMFLAPSGPTAQRPTVSTGAYPMVISVKFWDTTLTKMLMWDGKVWRDEGGTAR